MMALSRMAEVARGLGLTPLVLGDALEGEAREMGIVLSGLARSLDGGASFERVLRVPVIDRSDAEPHHRTSAFVRQERDGGYRMWYVAGDEWIDVGGKPLPRYNLRCIESPDGIRWPDHGRVVLDFANDDEHAFRRLR